MELLAEVVPVIPQKLDPFTPADVRQTVVRMDAASVAEPDGCEARRTSAVGASSLQRIAALSNLIEEPGQWPQPLLHGSVSLVPKAESDFSPDHQRPISVLSAPHRLRASTRQHQFVIWARQWAPPSVLSWHPGPSREDARYEQTPPRQEGRGQRVASHGCFLGSGQVL